MVLGPEPRPLSTYHVSELAIWVDSRDVEAAWLDPATGEIYPAFEGGAPVDENDEEIDLDDTDWVPIGGSGSHAAYQDMEDFAEAVADPVVGRRLREALGGRSAFRRFRDTMWHQPEEVGRAWSAYRELGAELRALTWLVDEGLVEAGQAAEARAEREAAAREILAIVGGGSRARLILLNGMPGVGKSTLAERFRADRPGVLCCDPDQLRPMVGGNPDDAAEAVRNLALAMATAHLRSGHDVVMPQLVADEIELQRFEDAAAAGGGELVMVMLVDDLPHEERSSRRPHENTHPGGLHEDLAGPDRGERLATYARRIQRIALKSGCATLACRTDQVDAAHQQLLRLLDRR